MFAAGWECNIRQKNQEALMYNRILVTLDTSKLAEIALPYAAELAPKLGAEVILLHVRTSADAPPENIDHKAYMDKIANELERKIKRSPAFKKGEKIKVKPELFGRPTLLANPAAEILDYAEKENVHLIIMGTHGRSGIGRWTLGSVANKVARRASCSLLLIRAGTAAPGKVSLEKILVPLDGSRASEAVLPYVETLASKFKSRVSLLNVVEPLYYIYPYAENMGYYGSAGVVKVPYNEEEMKPAKAVAEKYIKDINDKLSSQGVKTSYYIRTGSPGEEIINAEEEMHPDMVAMSTHGHSGFGRWDHGSIADKVLHAGTTPLLLVRPPVSPGP
jgi:nucleotide-binding universal stress UspA family protein